MKKRKRSSPQEGADGLPIDLESLRELFGQPIPLSPRVEQQIRPGLWRKVYSCAPPKGYQIRARFMHCPTPLLPSEEIAARIDERTLVQLKKEQDEVTGQLFLRALDGSVEAIFMLADLARELADALEKVEQTQPGLLRFVAETSANWPVVLSPNPQDIKAAIDQVKRLKVGLTADISRREGRIDARNIWTQLAEYAFNTCLTCRVFVPKLLSHCSGVSPHLQHPNAWRTEMKAEIYPVSPTDQIIISDWELRCVGLSRPVTRENFAQWWKCVHDCVLEHWWVYRDEYCKALRQIGRENEEEWRRRGMALDRVKQAFESLVNLPKKKSKSRTLTGTKPGQP